MPPEDYINPAQKEILLIEVVKKQIIRLLIIYLLISNVFIFLRLVLRLFGADPENLFAGFVFTISGLILLPFFGIFPQYREEIIAGDNTVDVSAFIALFCSNILVFMVMGIVYVVTRMLKTRKQAKETVEKSKPLDADKPEEVIS